MERNFSLKNTFTQCGLNKRLSKLSLVGLLGLTLTGHSAIAEDIQRYRVITNNATQAAKILHSFHHAVVSDTSAKASATNIMLELSNEEHDKLKRLGVTLLPITFTPKHNNTTLHQQAQSSNHSSDTHALSGIPNFSCYPTVEETYQQASDLAQTYPDIAKWQKIGESWVKQNSEDNAGYDINVLILTKNNNKPNKPTLFIHSAMHAREYTTAALTLEFAKNLANDYATDADVNWLLNEHEVHIVFMMNPDGRKQAETGLFWRKNANSNYCASQPNRVGADLNRNFSFLWNSTEGGSSGEGCSNTFRGPEPASEPETQAIEAYIRQIFPDSRGPALTDAAPEDTAGLHLDIHSFGGMVIWPWGFDSTIAPNGVALQTLGRKLAAFNHYQPFQSVGLYPTDGTADDFTYGELGVATFAFELGTTFFESCEVYEQQVKPTNLAALKYAAKVAAAPYLKPKGPDLLDMRLEGAGKIAVPPGTQVKLVGLATDTHFNYLENETQFEPTHTIQSVQYSINEYPNADGAALTNMQPVDGELNSATEQVFSVIVTTNLAAGDYNIYAHVKDSQGDVGVMSAVRLTIDPAAPAVVNQAPNAAYTYSCSDLSCDFDAYESTDDDGIVKYQWAINGRHYEGEKIRFDYAITENYNVSLTVTDKYDMTNTVTKEINLVGNTLPVASFTHSCTDLVCEFDATSSTDADGSIVEYFWLIEGQVIAQQKFSHTFSAAGTYQVSLSVYDNSQGEGRSAKSVTVGEQPSTDLPKKSSGGVLWRLLGLLGVISLFRLTNSKRSRVLPLTSR
ncbi:M14 family zinc carboxypeptidase [Flocculibacter collagenilyticus]|uniref:M14 family zinc carboxypeptidase n=1 Tax=Flocculibacter collagenilyticus TaxID=2744479 RepID=UPI0018F35C16|nr:M14 family zinc carboxypeptidase [Flocculibacter collagenilyticus]